MRGEPGGPGPLGASARTSARLRAPCPPHEVLVIPFGRRIAIIGAGGVGACAALELAARGHRIDLYERTSQAVGQASFVNEGKIHLGFLYAVDTSLRTSAQMIEGALAFEEYLRRWIPFTAADVASTPFHYCVHRGTLLDADRLVAHYERCAALYRERASATGRDYLGLGVGSGFAQLKREEYGDWLDTRYFDAVFRTTEHAVDPRAIALALRAAVAAEPRIALHTGHRVVGVRGKRGGFRVRFEHEGEVREESCTDVVNASWAGRLSIDRALGIVPPHGWLHRYKFGHRVQIALAPDAVPSFTCVQGPFGDIVNFGRLGMFLSWYPVGRTGLSADETPPDWHGSYTPEQRRDVFARSFAEWRTRCPRLDALGVERAPVDANGGVIYALGDSDVDDRKSRLHDRFEIGIQSRGRYHTIDTGKYTLVPWWGVRIADRVESAAA